MIACFQHNLLLLKTKPFLHKIIQAEQHRHGKVDPLLEESWSPERCQRHCECFTEKTKEYL